MVASDGGDRAEFDFAVSGGLSNKDRAGLSYCRIVGRRRDQRRIAALLSAGGARYTLVLSALRPPLRLALLAADAARRICG